jgi:hypothetical protein
MLNFGFCKNNKRIIIIKINHCAVSMLALHVEAAFSTGLSKQRQCGLHPIAESRAPDGARLVGAIQAAFELSAASRILPARKNLVLGCRRTARQVAECR